MADLFSNALLRSLSRDFSVADLIKTADLLRQDGKHQQAEGLYAAWIQHNQDHPLLFAVLFNQSVLLSDHGKLAEAKDSLQAALAKNPNFVPAHINLGRILERLGSGALAVAQWSVALGKMEAVTGENLAHKQMALNQAARVLEDGGQDAPAEALLLQSLDLDCRQREVVQHYLALRQRQCKWPVVEEAPRVPRRALLEAMSPLSLAAYTDDPILQLAAAARYNEVEVGDPPTARFAWPRAEEATGPLRIGYLSSDLREHAVGYLMTEVPELHDRSKVSVHCYYCGPATTDPLHARFRKAADAFVDIATLSDQAAAERIAADGIQILVDLNGYTREARLKLVALRPAPVIVNWLGYPGTMGSPYHHYIVSDETIVPPSHERFYSEKVVRLPCYQPNNRRREVADAPTRESQGLPDDAVVFCCFNGSHKLTTFTFDRWLTVLERVPRGILWLLDSGAETSQRLRDLAARRGLDPARVVFAQKLPNARHLARYPLADLFLDTAPYGAHTTASDALYMGLPVLTVAGHSFAARVCASLVRAAGVPELECGTLGAYVDRAVELGNTPSLLRDLRHTLAEGKDRSILFDTPGLVRALEGLYETMWRDRQAGFSHRPDLANLSAYAEVGRQTDPDQIELQSVEDYEGYWKALLRRRHAVRPLAADRRFCDDLDG